MGYGYDPAELLQEINELKSELARAVAAGAALAEARAEVERLRGEVRSFRYVECENCGAMFGQGLGDDECGPMHYAVHQALASPTVEAEKERKP